MTDSKYSPNWYSTHLRINGDKTEDWKVPSDHHGADFETWLGEYDKQRKPGQATPVLKAMKAAWDASITHHTATLRRIGWIDQKGRVWLEVPSSKDFDGGSLTPLLVDVRES